MKELILAGGNGTHLCPLPYTSTKHPIPIAGKSSIQYGIEATVAAGITYIDIIVGDNKAKIKKELGDGSKLGVGFIYIEQDALWELAHAIMIF